jgi:hypothetical protein
MAYGKVIGGHYVNATISTNLKGELALRGQGFKRTPNLTAENVVSWQEVPAETRGGVAGAVNKVGQAVARAALPGTAGKAAQAAVESTVDSVTGAPHHVRVGWADGKQSLISLPDKLFQHLAILLADKQIASAVPPPAAMQAATSEAPTGLIGQIAKLAAPTLGGLAAPGAVAQQPDLMDQLTKLAALRDQGVLTDDEFTAKKAELLARL